MDEFRVLVLDDDARVINQLKDRISSNYPVLKKNWDVIIEGVTIGAASENDESKFTAETLRNLIKALSEKPHLILADFGYTTRQNSEKLQKGEITGEIYIKNLLTVADLMPQIENFLKKNRKEKGSINKIRANFQDNSCKIFLYTFTPDDIKNDAPSIEARRKRCENVFRKSKVIAIDTRARFYNDNPKFLEKHDKEFYAFLVTELLENIVKHELWDFASHNEIQKAKFFRYGKSVLGVLLLALIGGAIGAAGELIGDLVTDSFSKGSWMLAGFTIVMGILLFLGIGLALPFIFEKTLLKLLTKLKDEDWDVDKQ
jgi:hypothetical protein